MNNLKQGLVEGAIAMSLGRERWEKDKNKYKGLKILSESNFRAISPGSQGKKISRVTLQSTADNY